MSWLDKLRQAVNPAHRSAGAVKTGKKENEAKKDAGSVAAEPGATNITGAIPQARVKKSRFIKNGKISAIKRQALSRLSPREKEVFARCLEGMKMKDIAGELQIKTSTVNGYCREVYKKLGVNSKAQLIINYSEFKDL